MLWEEKQAQKKAERTKMAKEVQNEINYFNRQIVVAQNDFQERDTKIDVLQTELKEIDEKRKNLNSKKEDLNCRLETLRNKSTTDEA